MATSKDWLPSGRHDQLAMAKNWLRILNAPGTGTGPGGSATPAERWGISADAVNDLGKLTEAAEKALAAAKSEETRTPVATVQCKTAFEALLAKMRDIKKRSFYTPR